MNELNECKVLAVEDSPLMRDMLKIELEKIGITEITLADDGEHAWNIIMDAHENNEMFDIVVSDWHMPKLSGQELLYKIRISEFDDINTLFFIMVTSDRDSENVSRALKIGANSYITKPINSENLKVRIETFLAERVNGKIKKAGIL